MSCPGYLNTVSICLNEVLICLNRGAMIYLAKKNGGAARYTGPAAMKKTGGTGTPGMQVSGRKREAAEGHARISCSMTGVYFYKPGLSIHKSGVSS